LAEWEAWPVTGGTWQNKKLKEIKRQQRNRIRLNEPTDGDVLSFLICGAA